MTKEFNNDSDTKKDPIVPDTGDVTAEQIDNISAFASLRITNFRFLLGGSILSNAAQWIQMVTLSWLVYSLTGSGTMQPRTTLTTSPWSKDRARFRGIAPRWWIFQTSAACSLIPAVRRAG